MLVIVYQAAGSNKPVKNTDKSFFLKLNAVVRIAKDQIKRGVNDLTLRPEPSFLNLVCLLNFFLLFNKSAFSATAQPSYSNMILYGVCLHQWIAFTET